MSDYAVWVCLECGRQGSPPGRDGIERCGGGAVAHPSGITQPNLCRVQVRISDEGTSQHLARARRRTEEAEAKQRDARAPSPDKGKVS